MKNADKIVAQAREWATLACAIVEMRNIDSSTVAGVQDACTRAVELCAWAELEYRSASAGVRSKAAYWARAEGTFNALSGLLRLWTAVYGHPTSEFDTRDGMRRGFLDCAAGLATVFSAPGGFTACKPAQHAARKGAQELFDALAREEES